MADEPLDRVIELLGEVADRARRTETRVTKIANHLEVDAGGEKPRFHSAGNFIKVPSRKVSLEDILAAIPRGQETAISLYCGDDFLGSIAL
jgi:hypothetical protein